MPTFISNLDLNEKFSENYKIFDNRKCRIGFADLVSCNSFALAFYTYLFLYNIFDIIQFSLKITPIFTHTSMNWVFSCRLVAKF